MLQSARRKQIRIGPADHGRRMSLDDFDRAIAAEGWNYELGKGVIEVISESSRQRDYEVKPDEYLAFGVDEYWIVDATKQQMIVHERWRGQWKEHTIKPPKKYATRWLPGFTLDLKRVLAAAKPRTGVRNGK